MLEFLKGLLFKQPSKFEYIKERYNLCWGEDGSDVYIVNVNGDLHVYSYDDYTLKQDEFINHINKEAVALAKRLRVPVWYHYRTERGVESVNYNYKRRGLYA